MNKALEMRRPQAFERFFDMTCSTLGLLFLLPLLAGVALVILLDDGSPVLFSSDQSRSKREVVPHLEVQDDALWQPWKRYYGGGR